MAARDVLHDVGVAHILECSGAPGHAQVDEAIVGVRGDDWGRSRREVGPNGHDAAIEDDVNPELGLKRHAEINRMPFEKERRGDTMRIAPHVSEFGLGVMQPRRGFDDGEPQKCGCEVLTVD
ncbi:MAG: hypothetical protein EXQ48_08975 [Acidobacteria bacterium]|nr:hypothetical protein [Acidobacteriota bacterium]